jgi:hypothetical protein
MNQLNELIEYNKWLPDELKELFIKNDNFQTYLFCKQLLEDLEKFEEVYQGIYNMDGDLDYYVDEFNKKIRVRILKYYSYDISDMVGYKGD